MTIFSRTLDNGTWKSVNQCEELLFVYGEYRETTNDISDDGGSRTISNASLIMLLQQMNDRIYELESELRQLKGRME
jgi:hypothetical protein